MHSTKHAAVQRKHGLLLAWGLAALALFATPALAADTLVVNGKPASQDVRTIGGSAYVKLSDIAKALGMIVVKRPGGYELTKAGGANQVQGLLQGKVGDILFDGFWRFQVLSVETPESYKMLTENEPNALAFDRRTRLVHARPHTKLITIHCRMTNGQKSVQTFWLAPLPGERQINNSLTDTHGESYPPDCYDLDGSTSQSKPLLPGAKTDFSILFSIPETVQREELKDLVFTLQNNDARPGSDVRVSLTP